MERLLFIPASGPKGSGEYFRSLNIANSLSSAIHNVEVSFVLNTHSPFTQSCPYQTFEIDDIPTRSVPRVNGIIKDVKPHLVIFDATGRSSQVKCAKQTGAKTVFIAQNKSILHRALGLKRLAVTDEVWIVQPEYMLSPGVLGNLKLRISPVSCYQVGPVYPRLSPLQADNLRKENQIPTSPYILLNPGGGGHVIDQKPAARIFESCADMLQQQSGDYQVVLVYGPNYTGDKLHRDGIKSINKLNPEAFQAAIMGAAGFVSGGGGALFQATDAGIPTVGVPLSPDQSFRIGKMTANDIILEARPEPDEMKTKILNAIDHPPQALHNRKPGKHALDLVDDRVRELLYIES